MHFSDVRYTDLYVSNKKNKTKQNKTSCKRYILLSLLCVSIYPRSYLPVEFSIRSKVCQPPGRDDKYAVKTSNAFPPELIAWQVTKNSGSAWRARHKQRSNKDRFTPKILVRCWGKITSEGRSWTTNWPPKQNSTTGNYHSGAGG